MKRIKKVHNTDQMLHLFCNMIDGHLEGFKNTSGNVYFEKGTLYSYGDHYPMAKKYNYGVGIGYREVILINSNKSSVTTEKHKYKLRNSAKPDQIVINVPIVDISKDLGENESHLLDAISDEIDGIFRGLKYSEYSYVLRDITKLNDYYKIIGNKKVFKLPNDLDHDLKVMDAKKRDKFENRDKKKREQKLSKDKEIIDRTHSNLHLWLTRKNFSNLEPNNSEVQKLANWTGHDYCRVSIDRKYIVTQRGASVDFGIVSELLHIGETKGYDKLIGRNAGLFKIESYDNNGTLTIGCHKINIEQLKNAIEVF